MCLILSQWMGCNWYGMIWSNISTLIFPNQIETNWNRNEGFWYSVPIGFTSGSLSYKKRHWYFLLPLNSPILVTEKRHWYSLFITSNLIEIRIWDIICILFKLSSLGNKQKSDISLLYRILLEYESNIIFDATSYH